MGVCFVLPIQGKSFEWIGQTQTSGVCSILSQIKFSIIRIYREKLVIGYNCSPLKLDTHIHALRTTNFEIERESCGLVHQIEEMSIN